MVRIDGEGVGIAKLKILLRLIAGGGIELDVAEDNGGVGRLRPKIRTAVSVLKSVKNPTAAAGEILCLEHVQGYGHGLDRRPTAPFVQVQGRISADHGCQFVRAPLKVQQHRMRAAGLEKLVVHRAPATQEHVERLRRAEERIDQWLELANEIHVRAVLGVVGIHPVDIRIEVAVDGVAVGILEKMKSASKGQVQVPRHHLPFAGALGIAVEVIILVVTTILVLHQLNGGQEIDQLRDIDVIIQVALQEVAGEAGAVDQGLQIVIGFVLAGLLFGTRVWVIQRKIYLVERAIGIEPQPSQKIVIGAFDEMEHAVKRAVLLDADGKGEMRGHAGLSESFVGHDLAHVILFSHGREQVEGGDARGVMAPTEFVAAVQADVDALL